MRPVGALLVHCINGIEEASEHRIARQGCVKIVPWSLKDALIGKCFSCFGTFNTKTQNTKELRSLRNLNNKNWISRVWRWHETDASVIFDESNDVTFATFACALQFEINVNLRHQYSKTFFALVDKIQLYFDTWASGSWWLCSLPNFKQTPIF